MQVLRIRDPNALRPLHVVLLCVFAVTLTGGCLLLSAGDFGEVDGAIPWGANSPLRAVVQLLCLNYSFTTAYPGDVKVLILGLGTGVGLLAIAIGVLTRGRTRDEEEIGESASTIVVNENRAGTTDTEATTKRKQHIPPLIAAQVLLAMYLVWSLLGSSWSRAPELALGASVLLGMHVFWAFVLGWGLSRAATRRAVVILIAVTGVVSLIAIWYYHGRNPVLRAKFPFGNPTFLAAALLPGICLTVSQLGAGIRRMAKSGEWNPIGLFGCAAVLALAIWVLALTSSRGAMAGLAVGLLVMGIVALPGKAKIVPGLLILGVGVGGIWYISHAVNAPSATGRDETLRLRLYAWSYAWDMFNERPLTGYGPGGFVLDGDSYVVNDVLDDPQVFTARIAHTHNEWLEVLADLGSVGLVLVAAGLALTLWAGVGAVGDSGNAQHGWMTVGLVGALAALIVEEASGVGLRVSGVGLIFYTAVGLLWSLSSGRDDTVLVGLSRRASGRIGVAVVCGLVGFVTLLVSREDFAAARADFSAQSLIDEGKYDEAVAAAERGADRLNPQRALTNLYRLAAVHLQIGGSLQHRARDRFERAQSGESPDRNLMALADADLKNAQWHCEQSFESLERLLSYAPGFINAGWLSYVLNRTMAEMAPPDIGKELMDEAGRSIREELRRQPFDPEIAALVAQTAPVDMSAEELMTILARPIRYHTLSPAYGDILLRLAATGVADQELAAMAVRARQAIADGRFVAATAVESADEPGDRAEAYIRWAPEILRLVGNVRFLRTDYVAVRMLLESAAQGYEKLANDAHIGAAACQMELANAVFFSNPTNPQAAIDTALGAMAMAPPSEAGRALVLDIKSNMVRYRLAAGHEPEAMQLLRDTAPVEVGEAAVQRELAQRYADLCSSLMIRRGEQLLRDVPEDLLSEFRRWADRARELQPANPDYLYLSASVAFAEGDLVRVERELREALALGLRSAIVDAFLHDALARGTDSEALLSFRRELGFMDSGDEDAPAVEAPEPLGDDPSGWPASPPIPPPGSGSGGDDDPGKPLDPE